ncbi:MAG: hypothetical protein GY811_03380 [Myxococcales bacterium]|nr:hypothetical protein [Myxococcales bacterium]
MMRQRLVSSGLRGIHLAENELVKQCGKSPKFSRMQRVLFQSALLAAANYGDCEWFDLYVKKWIALGGSAIDTVGYRKSFSHYP